MDYFISVKMCYDMKFFSKYFSLVPGMEKEKKSERLKELTRFYFKKNTAEKHENADKVPIFKNLAVLNSPFWTVEDTAILLLQVVTVVSHKETSMGNNLQ